jgi:hypothetical protein
LSPTDQHGNTLWLNLGTAPTTPRVHADWMDVCRREWTQLCVCGWVRHSDAANSYIDVPTIYARPPMGDTTSIRG